jgi:hypothetical protein
MNFAYPNVINSFPFYPLTDSQLNKKISNSRKLALFGEILEIMGSMPAEISFEEWNNENADEFSPSMLKVTLTIRPKHDLKSNLENNLTNLK